MKSILLSILYCVVVFSQIQTDIQWPTLADSPWPMVKHDPQFTGRSPYKGPQTPTVIWTRQLRNGIFSGPVIGKDQKLLFGSYFQDPWNTGPADSFYCFNFEGRIIWTYKLGNSRAPQSGILVDSSGTIYFGALDNNLYALYPDGTLKWKYETSSPISMSIPNIDLTGNIYICNDNELYSISSGGQKNWSVTYESGFRQRSAAISPSGNTLYIPAVDSNLFALNLDGTIKWKFGCGKIYKAPAVDAQGNIYFIPLELPQHFYSLNEDGSIRWKKRIQNVGNLSVWSIPTIDKLGNIYVVAIDSLNPIGRALLSYNYYGNLRWKYVFENQIDDIWQPLICDSEGTIYLGSTFGFDYYAISSNGLLKWKLTLEGIYNQVDNTGAIAEDGTLFLGLHGPSAYYSYVNNLYAIKDTGSVGVGDVIKKVEKFCIDQNYPNPFNPSTTIKYSVPEPRLVYLSVYNILGQEIIKLVNEIKPAGTYSVNFNAAGLPGGVYVYRLQAGDYRASKKMILLK